MLKKILAVIISYNSLDSLTKTVEALRSQKVDTLVVDNGSKDITSIEWDSLVRKNSIDLVKLDSNYGIAYALNIGARYADESGYEWILTMDQDSIIQAGFIDSYIKYLQCNPMAKSLSPVFNNAPPADDGAVIDLPITSGNLLRLDVFKQVGFFAEDYFIDYVDFEFALRLKRHGIDTCIVRSAELNHRLGEDAGRLELISKFYTNHSPLRRYYKHRNMHYLVADYFKIYPWMCTKLLISNYISMLFVICFDKKRFCSLRYIFRGFYHFTLGITGAANEKN